MASIGGQVEGSGHQYGCCDVCTDGKVLNSRLDVLASRVCKRKSKVRKRRTVSPSLEAKLMAIREEVLDEHPSFKMVGADFFCPASSIKKLCTEAEFASEAKDFSVYIRPELKDKFLNVILL